MLLVGTAGCGSGPRVREWQNPQSKDSLWKRFFDKPIFRAIISVRLFHLATKACINAHEGEETGR
jgi:hypothetical protein